MPGKKDTGRNPSSTQLFEALRIAQLPPSRQIDHWSAVPADTDKLAHINTYVSFPEYYIDQPFICRVCGKRGKWRAKDQKCNYQEAKGQIDSVALECRKARVSGGAPP